MRSFNYTGRKKISHEHILLSIRHSSEGVSTFSADFDLNEYKFKPESKVVVEAYYQANWLRFDFGTIENIKEPKETNLDQFVDVHDIRFRVKVTDSSVDKILALADKIKPVVDDPSDVATEGILPIKTADLHGAIWRLEFPDDTSDMVNLLIDKSLGDKNVIHTDVELRALISPTAFREIIIRILLHESNFDLDDKEDWRSIWLNFCMDFGYDDPPDDEADIEDKYEWIDGAVARFCRSHKFLENFNMYREEAEK